MTIDWTKPIQNKRGLSARLIGTFDGGDYTQSVAIKLEDGLGEYHSVYASDGRYYSHKSSDLDLINVPVKIKEYWNAPINGGTTYRHASIDWARQGRALADGEPSPAYVTLEVTKVDGVVKAVKLLD